MNTSTPDAAATLREVLVGELPATLGTPPAPVCYDVAIVLSRRISREEKVLVESTETEQALAREGFPDARLSVVDRRLLIANTSLEELANGLSRVIATIVRDACHAVETVRREREQRVTDDAARETTRSDAVTVLARSIDLSPRDLADGSVL